MRVIDLLPLVALTTFWFISSSAEELDLQGILGDRVAREQACNDYQLPNDVTDTSFLGPYRSIVVGTVNYTYHRFTLQEDGGANNTLVLIPGGAATSAVWQGDFLRGLAQDREVITFDPRGYASADTAPLDQLTIDSIASSLVDFFDALGLESPDLFGWSWGGFITLWLGAFYGDSVGNLIVFSTTSGGEQLLPGPQYESIIAGSLQGQGTPPGDIFPDSKEGNAALCSFIAFARIMPGPIFSPDQIRNQTNLLNSVFAQNTLTDALSNITNPLLVGHGSLDIVLSAANAEFLYSNVSDVRLQIGSGSGHAYLFQELDAVLAGVQEFLDDNDDSDSSTGPASN